MFPYGKQKIDKKSLYDILQNERRILKDIDGDGKKKCMSKVEMRKLLGFSPDYLECLSYIVIFHLENVFDVESEGLMYL